MSKSRKILVTGGAGYIGSVTCRFLFDEGYDPVVVDNLSTGHIENIRWGSFYNVDLRDEIGLSQVFRENDFQAVIHFAARAYVGESVANPLQYYDANVSATLTLLRTMEKTGVDNLVFSSSCATYGIVEPIRINEEIPQVPINPYGWSKLHCEQMIKDCASAKILKFAILRYFNAAGADLAGGLAELHTPETHLLPLAFDAAKTGEPLAIYGSDYGTPDGTAIRDYIHVLDLASAHVAALKKVVNEGHCLTLNLGAGQGTSVLQIVKAIERLGISLPYFYASRRKGDPEYLVADTALAKKLLAWEPTHSSIDEIIKSVYDVDK
jgi:UDP-arabinose 4-epimerase